METRDYLSYIVNEIHTVIVATVISPAFLSCVRIFLMITGLVFILPARKSLVILYSSLNVSTQVKICRAIVNLLDICIV